ncbi:hypothetical protein A2U01_0090551 [Trifolium medium]|uniref:Uncharacterized protein n=1 Tax=Trifolium medium TaxID=97028 RepID=A0A392UA31_9FABA|nr:hypothetical protein [Trifolium medium]
MKLLVTARRAGDYGALRRSLSNGKNSLGQLRIAQPGMARRAVESSRTR